MYRKPTEIEKELDNYLISKNKSINDTHRLYAGLYGFKIVNNNCTFCDNNEYINDNNWYHLVEKITGGLK